MKNYMPFYALFALVLIACTCCENTSQNLETNKKLIKEFTEATNAQDWDVFNDLLTEDFKRHCQATPDAKVNSVEDFINLQKSFISSMPDQKVTTKMLIAEGDKVAAYAVYSGTMSGPMGEFPATGKTAELNFMTIFRISEGRIAEIWVEWDNIAMLSQLGLFPPPQ
jgi:steroid delta-isomerase-like uncharacterized protein